MKTLILMIQALMLMGLFSGCNSDNNGSDGDNIEVAKPNYTGWAIGASVDGYGTIIHTTDSGTTWERQGNTTMIPDVPLSSVDAVDELNVWAVGKDSHGINGISYGTILHSSDAGESWERQGTPESIPEGVGFLGISAINRQVAWTAGTKKEDESISGIIMYTDDGGSHWYQQASFPNINIQKISAADEDNVWVVGMGDSVNGQPGTVFIARTTDGGKNWERMQTQNLDPSKYLIDVHAVTADIVWVVGRDTVATTVNGGKNWVRNGPPVGMLDINGVCALDEKSAWIAADSFDIQHTSDSGFTWTLQHKVNVDADVDDPGLAGAYIRVTAMDKHSAWIVGFNPMNMEEEAIILHTVDGGQKWMEQTSPANAKLQDVSFVGDVR